MLTLESADVMTTGLYLLCFISSITLFVLAIRGGPWYLWLFSGLAAALTFLPRMEGAILIPLGLVGLGVRLMGRIRRGESCRRLLAGAAGGIVVLAIPLLVHMERILSVQSHPGASRSGEPGSQGQPGSAFASGFRVSLREPGMTQKLLPLPLNQR